MANQKISEMDPVAALTGSELVEVVQDGENLRTTTGEIAALGGGGGGGFPDAPSDGKLYGRRDGGWEEVPAGGSDALQVITEAAAFTATPATHAGLTRYIRAAGDVTFDGTEGYSAGQVFNIRATVSLSLIGSGVALSTTHGGTLDMEAGMAVTVIMTAAAAGDVIGQTVAA